MLLRQVQLARDVGALAQLTEARDQLRSAFDALTSMGAEAFAERARRELLATGETARKRSDETRTRRTVEWHLRKVFAKLDISSRLELDQALRKREVRS